MGVALCIIECWTAFFLWQLSPDSYVFPWEVKYLRLSQWSVGPSRNTGGHLVPLLPWSLHRWRAGYWSTFLMNSKVGENFRERVGWFQLSPSLDGFPSLALAALAFAYVFLVWGILFTTWLLPSNFEAKYCISLLLTPQCSFLLLGSESEWPLLCVCWTLWIHA